MLCSIMIRPQVLRIAGDLYQYGYDPRRLCRDLLEHFHQLVIAKVSPDPALPSRVTRP